MGITRRAFVGGTAALLASDKAALAEWLAAQVPRPVPTRSQLAWQRDELAMFIHFGVNTFTDREWGDGTESPSVFAPAKLDARQWARAAKAAGFRAMILTAKHHDGFCLWPTATTTHSVAQSAWRDGQGDVVREFTEACRAEGLKAGLYCSPWDRHEASYGTGAAYNDYFCAQLTELLTRYGPIAEVWFDGANGEGPNGRVQAYDWARYHAVVRRLMPDAVMFSDAGPDVRWIGNERGAAGETNWSMVDPAAVPFPGATGDAVERMLQQGDPTGTVWRPGETDVSIRPGWFYHAAEDAQVKDAANLVDLYCTSVGRNSKLLLNVPPTRDGLLHDRDVAALAGMHAQLTATFGRDLAAGARTRWRAGGKGASLEVTLARAAIVSVIDLREAIQAGQCVARYVVEAAGEAGDGGAVTGMWREIARGTTIGYRKIDRIAPVRVQRLRVRIEDAVAPPQPLRLALHAAP
jgi:alpha-L-fucosidase